MVLISWAVAAWGIHFTFPQHWGVQVRVIGELLVTAGAGWAVGARAARTNSPDAYIVPFATAILFYGAIVLHAAFMQSALVIPPKALRPGWISPLPWLWRIILPVAATAATAVAVWSRGDRKAASIIRAVFGGGLAGTVAFGLLYHVYFRLFVFCFRDVAVDLVIVGAMLVTAGYIAGAWAGRTSSLRFGWLPGAVTTIVALTV